MMDLFKKSGPPGPADPQLLQEVKAYIDAYLEPEEEAVFDVDASFCQEESQPVVFQKLSSAKHASAKEASFSMPAMGSALPADLGDYLDQIDAGFSETLLKLIDQTGEKDSAIYKRANVDRKLFSKIRSNPAYKPSKATALAFALALRLDLEETNELLSRAGYVLSHSSAADLAVEYFIEHQIYDIDRINEVLYAYDLPLIGGTA